MPAERTEVEVVGQQWLWSFRLPGADGKLGTSETRPSAPENPLGVNTNDPNGLDDVIIEGGELHLPVGKPVKMLLRSVDVLHDFYVPEFRAKMDMVPGMVTYFWFTPTRTGTFEVLCAELCGIGHPQMRGTVVVDEEADYQHGCEQQQTFTQLLAAAGEKQPARAQPPRNSGMRRKQGGGKYMVDIRSGAGEAIRLPKSRMWSSTIRRAGGRNMSSARMPRSSPSSIR